MNWTAKQFPIFTLILQQQAVQLWIQLEKHWSQETFKLEFYVAVPNQTEGLSVKFLFIIYI